MHGNTGDEVNVPNPSQGRRVRRPESGQTTAAKEVTPAAAVVCAAPGGVSASIVLKLYAALMVNQKKLAKNAAVPIHAKLTTPEAEEVAQIVEDAGGYDEVITHYA